MSRFQGLVKSHNPGFGAAKVLRLGGKFGTMFTKTSGALITERAPPKLCPTISNVLQPAHAAAMLAWMLARQRR
jgi:hypothetical protein